MRKSENHVFWATYQHMYKNALFECNDLFNLFPFTKFNFYQKCFERKGSKNVHGWLMTMGCRLQCAGGGDGRPRRSSGRGGGQNQRTWPCRDQHGIRRSWGCPGQYPAKNATFFHFCFINHTHLNPWPWVNIISTLVRNSPRYSNYKYHSVGLISWGVYKTKIHQTNYAQRVNLSKVWYLPRGVSSSNLKLE